MRALLAGVGRTALIALAAAATIGAIEGVRLWVWARGGPGAVVLALGLSITGAVVPGMLLVGAMRVALGQRWVSAWRSALAEPGEPRATAVVQAVVALAAVAALALATFSLAVWTHGRFRAPGAVGLLHAAVAVGTVLALGFGGSWAAHRLAALLAGRRWVHRATSGWPGRCLLAAAIAGAAIAVAVIARRAAPAADFRPQLVVGGWLVALAVFAWIDPVRRLRRRGSWATGCALIAATLAGLATVGTLAAARQAVAAQGVASRAVLAALWRLTDRDRDGYAAHFGGADCDDTNPAINPGAREIIGNGVDENCSGGDLDAGALTPRARPQPTSYPRAARHNVLLISIDTVRADHASAYGYERPTTPVLDRLAQSGAVFAWAISPSPTTRRAIPAMMTGRYASTLAFKESDRHWPPTLVARRHSLLGQSFRAAGYDTFAVLCCDVLFNKAAGVVEGIDRVDASPAAIRKRQPHNADVVAHKTRELLRSRRDESRPFFLWVHFIDPHNPYDPVPGATIRFGDSEIDRYDGEIRYVDDQVGTIVDELVDAGLDDRTIIAVTSDHGDEFEEHGNKFHGRSLYNELVRVPLVVRVPGVRQRRIENPVSLIDLGTTLLDLVGIDRPAGWNARSLAPAIVDGAAAPDRTVLAELIADRNIKRNLKAAFHGQWKLIWDVDAGTYELYSLADDPADRHDRRATEPGVLDEMKRRLREAVDLELTALPGEPGKTPD